MPRNQKQTKKTTVSPLPVDEVSDLNDSAPAEKLASHHLSSLASSGFGLMSRMSRMVRGRVAGLFMRVRVAADSGVGGIQTECVLASP